VLEPGHRYRLVVTGTVSDWCPPTAKKQSDCSYGSPFEVGKGVHAVWCYAAWRCATKEAWQQLNVNGRPGGGRSETGASSPATRRLQQHLASLGFYTGPLDGKGGPSLDAAIKNLQHNAGIPADGKCGARCQHELVKALSR